VRSAAHTLQTDAGCQSHACSEDTYICDHKIDLVKTKLLAVSISADEAEGILRSFVEPKNPGFVPAASMYSPSPAEKTLKDKINWDGISVKRNRFKRGYELPDTSPGIDRHVRIVADLIN